MTCQVSTRTTSTEAEAEFVDKARQLTVPTNEQQLARDPYVHYFWERYGGLLEKAWGQWSETEGLNLPRLDSSLYHPSLRKAIEEAWLDPTKEHAVRDLWKEVSPGVYQCQFFDIEKIRDIREYFDKAAEARIPTKAPHGITLNRKGFMLDPRSDGYLAIPDFQSFYRDLVDTYMRPLGRLFFPEYIQEDDDTDSFGFSIQYQAGKDRSIQQHSDASSLTLNINLNLPNGEENYSGSSLYFVDPTTGAKNRVDFAPGVAVMHRGATPHAALPITKGERSNMVVWLYGKYGHTSHFPYSPQEQMSRQDRWTKPTFPNSTEQTAADKWTPF